MPATAVEIHEFDPVLFSMEENQWLLDHLGDPPVVAMKDVRVGVNPNAVRPLMDRVLELDQLAQHDHLQWVGVDVMKQTIQTYLREDAKWASDHKRNKRAPRFPSLYSFDSKGRAHLGGPGSDSGRVHTYFDAKANRLPFAIQLVTADANEWVAPGFTEKTESGMVVNESMHRLECFCGHTEAYKEDSRGSFNMARTRFSKHLRKATENVEQHRELHTLEFGQ